MRHDPRTRNRLFAALATLLVITLIGFGYFLRSTPASSNPIAVTETAVQTPGISESTPQSEKVIPAGGSEPSAVASPSNNPQPPQQVPTGQATATTAAVAVSTTQQSQLHTFLLYSGGKLADSWENASWSTNVDLQSSAMLRDGHPTLQISYQSGWAGFVLADWNQRNSIDTSKYSELHFWIAGGRNGGQSIGIVLGDERVRIDKYIKGGRIAGGTWLEVRIPLSDLKPDEQIVSKITFQESSGQAPEPVYIDGLEFSGSSAPAQAAAINQAQITIDLQSKRQPISPLIYGMSQAPEDVAQDTNIPLNRLGGNPYSTYNWTLGNARNAGSDWEFRNYSREPNDPAYKLPSGLADMFFKANKRTGALTMLTVPTLGYVAKDDNNETRSLNVPAEGGAPVAPGSEAIQGYDPKQNQQATSVKSAPSKGQPFQDPPAQNTGVVYQDEWIYHLVQTFGKALEGGVRFYAMDNEPDLWADDTHIDLHPVRVGYDELLQKFLAYAQAVKAVDPTAQITGPVVSGWTGYWFSALDRGNDGFKTAADRKAHGNMPLIAWFLDQVRKHDETTGQRSLDVLDIHYYPQGTNIYSDKIDPATSALRLRATRSLWDPTYVDESWISRTEKKEVELIPMMRRWIDQYYPGTKLGITEWNFGAEKTMNGALAIADVLGIFGREGVYLATYWTNPPLGSPGQQAFKMYRNYDGQKNTFGDVSVSAQSSLSDMLAVFASDDTQAHQVKVMVINKSDKNQTATHIDLRGQTFSGPVKIYQLSNATNQQIQALPDGQLNGSSIDYTFAPYSVTLLVIDYAH